MALRLCEDRLAVAPNDTDAQRNLGQLYDPQGELDGARLAARRATELAPKAND